MSIARISYQRVDITITAAGQSVPIDAETDKQYARCTGVNAIISNDNAKFSSVRLEINSKVIFDNYELWRIKFRENVPFGYEYHKLEEPAAGSTIKGTYKDSSAPTVAYPYTVSLSFRLENDTDTGKL